MVLKAGTSPLCSLSVDAEGGVLKKEIELMALKHSILNLREDVRDEVLGYAQQFRDAVNGNDCAKLAITIVTMELAIMGEGGGNHDTH